RNAPQQRGQRGATKGSGAVPVSGAPPVVQAARLSVGRRQASRLYHEAANAVSADELLGGAARRQDAPRDRAAAFLEQFLAAGPRTSRDIWQAAQKAACRRAPCSAPSAASASAPALSLPTAASSATGSSRV